MPRAAGDRPLPVPRNSRNLAFVSVIDRMPSVTERAAPAKQFLRDKLAEHHRYIRQYRQDMPEIRNWAWRAR
jgi:phosphoketolase